MEILGLHHIAIICSHYDISKQFYTEILGFKIEQEIYRSERDSYKLDLSLNGNYLIELFSFPNPPTRPSRPESTGLRHIAFAVTNIQESVNYLSSKNIICEDIRIDETRVKDSHFLMTPIICQLRSMKLNLI